ncbi:MAG: helix-turn-helix domain-containing protein [Candidatus Hydrothermales bacterium]
MSFEKEIGEKIRKLRKADGITLSELALRSGITKSALSQIERGKITPTISTFKNILDALGLTFSEFFEKEEKGLLFKFSKLNYKYIEKENVKILLLTPFGGNKSFDILKVEIPPFTSTRPETPHEGEEGGFVLKGAVFFQLGKRRLKVLRGESYYFHPDKVHFFENRSKNKSALLIHIVSPPNIDIF